MSDDLVELGKHAGSGGLGAIVYGVAARMLLGSGIADIKERLAEQKADTKEQIQAVKEMIERSDRRHDDALREATTTKDIARAAHDRYDRLEQRISDLEHESKRIR